MQIDIIQVGKTKNKEMASLSEYYTKLLGAWTKINDNYFIAFTIIEGKSYHY